MSALEKPALGARKSPEERERHRKKAEAAARQKASVGDSVSPTAEHLGVQPGDPISPGPEASLACEALSVAPGHLSDRSPGSHASDRSDTSETSSLERFRARVLVGDAIKTIPKPFPLVGEYLTLDSTAVLYGASSAGKTFVATSLAMSVSTGSWWFGREVVKGPVLYIAAESPSVLGERVGAWQTHENVPLNGVHWYPHAASLLDPVDAATVAGYAAEHGIVLVVIDTLARCMVGGDENSGRDMGLVVRSLDTIREACGGCVLVVHHSGKDTERGSRGHSSLRAAVDTELEVRGGDGQVAIVTRKQRAGAEPEPLNLRLVAAGDSVALTTRLAVVDGGALPKKAEEALKALAAIEVPGGVSTSAWCTSSDLPERTFYRARKTLLDLSMVRNIGTEQAPKYLTTATAKSLPTTANGPFGSTASHCHPPIGVAGGSATANGSAS